MYQDEIESIIKQIDWDKSPLIPTITQDYKSKEVLMLGFINPDSLRLSLSTGLVHYFSRSKNRIWKKGEESSHTQEIIEIFLDCDNDTLLFMVKQNGVACHTGSKTCFFKKITPTNGIEINHQDNVNIKYNTLDILYHTLQDKKFQSPKTSYTASLYEKGDNEICKKIIEEAGEFCFALKDNQKNEIIYECADLFYHTLVGLSYKNISPDLIYQELKKRFSMSGIEEKNSRKNK